jgi:hypothetical protein
VMIALAQGNSSVLKSSVVVGIPLQLLFVLLTRSIRIDTEYFL